VTVFARGEHVVVRVTRECNLPLIPGASDFFGKPIAGSNNVG
jgi:hypothetical protein